VTHDRLLSMMARVYRGQCCRVPDLVSSRPRPAGSSHNVARRPSGRINPRGRGTAAIPRRLNISFHGADRARRGAGRPDREDRTPDRSRMTAPVAASTCWRSRVPDGGSVHRVRRREGRSSAPLSTRRCSKRSATACGPSPSRNSCAPSSFTDGSCSVLSAGPPGKRSPSSSPKRPARRSLRQRREGGFEGSGLNSSAAS